MLHTFLQNENISVAVVFDKPDQSTTSALNTIAGKNATPTVAMNRPIEIVQPLLSPELSALPDLRLLLESGEYQEAIDQCLQSSTDAVALCRKEILSFAESASINIAAAGEILQSWVFQQPEDMLSVMQLAPVLVKQGKFIEAIRRLALARSYQSAANATSRLSAEINSIAIMAVSRADLQGELDAVSKIMNLMVEVEPQDPRWRFKQANTFLELEKHRQALNALTYILYDTEFGPKAKLLYEKTVQRLSLAENASISLAKTGAHFIVRGVVNGVSTVNLLIDTGASITTLDPAILQRLGLDTEAGETVTLHTAGGKVQSSMVNLNSLSIAGQTINNLKVARLPLNQSGIDGLLGMNYLRHFKFVLDQETRKLYLSPK